MKYKKIMLLTVVLLAILTIGAVSASEDTSDENMTVTPDSDADAPLASDSVDELETDNRYEVSCRISIPDSVRVGEQADEDNVDPIVEYSIYDDATGTLSIEIDNQTRHTQELMGYDYGDFKLNDLGIIDGKHLINVKYSGDENYLPFNVTKYVDFYYMKVNVPDPVQIGYWNDMQISVDFALNAQGTMKVLIDGREYKTYRNIANELYDDFLEEHTSTIYVDLSERIPAIGNHTYEIIYSGGNYPDKTFKGNFTVDYIFYADLNDVDDDNETVYGERITADIRMPDATGRLVMNLNGRDYVISFNEDNYDILEYVLPDLSYGTNNITFTYTHSKYPQKTVSYSVNAKSIILLDPDEHDIVYKSGSGKFSILLPEDAVGNLSIYEAQYDIVDLIRTTPVVNGKAVIGIDDLPIGDYNMIVKYDGDDYAVENETYFIAVIPKVDYTKGIWSKSTEESSVSVLTPSDSAGNLTIKIYERVYDYEHDDYSQGSLIRQLYNGSAGSAVTRTIPILPVGKYFLVVEYIEDEDNTISRRYALEVRDVSPDWKMKVNIPSVLTVSEYDENILSYYPSNKPADADGKFEFYIDNILQQTNSEEDYDFEFEYQYDHLTKGVHTWQLKYYGDSYYNPTSLSGKFTVKAYKEPKPVKKVNVIKLTLKKVKVKRSAKKLTLTATLKINGKTYKGKKITFKFNKKKYTAKTNKKGVAKVTIKKKILKKLKKGKKVKYQATYGKTTKKLTVKVYK